MEEIQKHLFMAFALRITLVTYGIFHDYMFSVPYTDVDYKVFTDAARYAWEGESPFKRITFRYPPLIAWILIPNLWIAIWGKVLFSLSDVFVGWITYKIAERQRCPLSQAIFCAKTWLYNPFAIIISTRGNSDSLTAALILSSLLFVMQNKIRPLVAGILLGFAIHIRLYPIAFSFPMFLSLQNNISKKKIHLHSRLYNFLIPNVNSFLLTVSCILTLAGLTASGWWMYGWQYLQESILYHLSRRDTRHNFSVYFYQLYLNVDQPMSLWQRAYMLLPQASLLLALAITFGARRNDLPFCFLIQSCVMVTYNTVVTAQYFIWFLSLLPPVLPFLALSRKQVIRIVVFWVGAQVTWLIPAYILEFQGTNTFLYIWFHGLAFFCSNVFAIGSLIKSYCPPDDHKLKLK